MVDIINSNTADDITPVPRSGDAPLHAEGMSTQTFQEPTKSTVDESFIVSGDGSSGFGYSPKVSSSRFKNIGIGIVFLMLLIALPVGVYFVSQRQSLNDIRNRAATYPPPSSCGGISTPSLGCVGGSWFCNSNGSWGCDMGGTITGACPNPYLTGGGDPCMKNGVHVSCSQVGMIRCYCGGPAKDKPGAVWVAGSSAGGATCDDMCGGVGYNCGSSCQKHDEPAITTTSSTNTPTPTRIPTYTPTSTISTTPTRTPTHTPTGTLSVTPTHTPTGTLSVTPTHTPTGTLSVTPTHTPTATPTVAVGCNEVCTINTDCLSGMVCADSLCRNPQCTEQASCQCASNTPTNTPTPTIATTPIAYVGCNSACTVNTDCSSGLVCIDSACRNPSCTEKTTCQCDELVIEPTPQTPVAGTGPSVLGAAVIAGGFLLLLVGLAL